jgi:hypothetical protein
LGKTAEHIMRRNPTVGVIAVVSFCLTLLIAGLSLESGAVVRYLVFGLFGSAFSVSAGLVALARNESKRYLSVIAIAGPIVAVAMFESGLFK